jgi:hypothetical protein
MKVFTNAFWDGFIDKTDPVDFTFFAKTVHSPFCASSLISRPEEDIATPPSTADIPTWLLH